MRESLVSSSERLGGGIPERCVNPVCGNLIEPLPDGAWRRTPRRFCSDQCKDDTSALRRAAAVLAGLSQGRISEILKEQANG